MITKIKIDAYSLKILNQLNSNPKISISDLSKIISRSKPFVQYRLDSLLKKKVVERLYPLIDLKKLGYNIFDAFIKTKGYKKEGELISWLKNNKNVFYIERLVGSYSIRISFFVKENKDAEKFTQEIMDSFSQEILEIETYPISSLIKTGNYPINGISSKIVKEIFNETDSISLEKKELLVLRSINKNIRKSILEISHETSLSRKFVKKTLSKLEEKRVLNGYALDIDVEKLNLIHKIFMLKLNTLGKVRLEKLKTYLTRQKEVQIISFYNLNKIITIEISIKNNENLREFQINLLENFSDIIHKIEVLDFYDEPKYSYMDEFLSEL